MKILIYGAGVTGKKVFELLCNEYEMENEIAGFIDKNKCGQYCGYPIYKLDEVKEFEGRILIALFNVDMAIEACKEIKSILHNDVFWYQYKRTVVRDDFFAEQCIDCSAWEGNILPQVEMHIVDSCNLNCRGCAHFSPIFPNDFPDLNSRLSDVKKLKSKLSHIIRFFILGGEPFLNPEIKEYICGIRRILPDTQLTIVTNGLLIERLDETVLTCIKDNDVLVSVSEYPPTHDRICSIRQILEENRILYEIRAASGREKFNMPFSLSDHSKYSRTCISNGCVTIWNGKISRCPQLMYVPYFNSYFQTKLPEEGVMSLDESPEGEELFRALKEEVPLCRHCVEKPIAWGICGKNAQLEDFATYE